MRVLETNCCVWGGQYNPIIPVYRRTPGWWQDKRLGTIGGSEIVEGYLQAFEPDFVVIVDESMRSFAPSNSRLIKLEDVLDQSRDEHIGYGISCCRVYQYLYEQRFQFQQRHPTRVVMLQATNDKLSGFGAAVIGRFPSAEGLQYFSGEYKAFFDATGLAVDGKSLQLILSGQVATPLQIGSSKLEVRRKGWARDPTLYLMDATSIRDLVDFWNLRALGWSVLPIPIQFQDSLADTCSSIITQCYVPDPYQPAYKLHTELLFSRSLVEANAHDFIGKLRLPGNDALVWGGNYPRIWDDWARSKDNALPCTLDGGTTDDECVAEDGRITFRSLAPKFDVGNELAEAPAWANVVRQRDYSHGSEVATLLPVGLPDVDRLLHTMRWPADQTRVTSEGIVTQENGRDKLNSWKVVSGVALCTAWFRSRGLDAELSGAGRIAMQMIRQLHGPLGAHLIANADILKMLDKMAHGLVETTEEAESAKGPKPRVRGRMSSWGQWWGVLRRIHQDDLRAARHFDGLTTRGVLEVGLKLECPHCTQTNWYALGQIAQSARCDRCLQAFSFPAARPPEQAWAYRTRGSFSIENYAQGAYAVAITLRFFLLLMHWESSWSPNLRLVDRQTQDDFEIDLCLWCQPRDPLLVIAECKSFNEQFGPDDLRRARNLALRFPGAVFVFATFREHLEAAERRRLAAFARWGRQRIRADQWRTPVLVLTAHELFGTMRPPECWREAGGDMAKFAENYHDRGSLIDLCDATQQLHLDMPSDAELRAQYFAMLRGQRATPMPPDRRAKKSLQDEPS